FTDDMPDLSTKDASLATAGVWIIEPSELDAMTRADVNRVKAFLSRRIDRFRPPYGRRFVKFKRQCIFAGSVNDTEYLKDDSGGRRFWPVRCSVLGLEALGRDRDQLWAEALVRYRRGEPWWLKDPELIAAAVQEQDDRFSGDPWQPVIGEWLAGLD